MKDLDIDFEALNEKLAKWRRLTHFSYAGPSPYFSKGIMHFRDEEGKGFYPTPFTHSFDVCQDWLVPEINKKGYEIKLWSFQDPSNKTVFWFCNILEREGDYVIASSFLGTPDPATAFCLAAEFMIKEEEDGGVEQVTNPADSYNRKREKEVQNIKEFIIDLRLAPLGTESLVFKCGINEPFRIEREHEWVSSEDIKIDVFDLRVGNNVAICGVQGRILKIKVVHNG